MKKTSSLENWAALLLFHVLETVKVVDTVGASWMARPLATRESVRFHIGGGGAGGAGGAGEESTTSQSRKRRRRAQLREVAITLEGRKVFDEDGDDDGALIVRMHVSDVVHGVFMRRLPACTTSDAVFMVRYVTPIYSLL